MFRLFRKTERALSGRPDVPLYDLHNHLLAGIDDGAGDSAESGAILTGLAGLGFRGICATPHWNHPRFPEPSVEDTARQLQDLTAIADGLSTGLRNGGEIMMRDNWVESLRDGRLPTIGGVALVEFPFRESTVIEGFEHLVFDFQTRGITLLIAHPERHPDFQRRPGLLERFRARGALLQLDLFSLCGRDGGAAKRLGWHMVRTGLADVAATDIHRADSLPLVEQALNALAARSEKQFVRLLSTNPGHIFCGHPERLIA